ncbi:MAG: hypothetical protein KGZ63_04160 [Clostridiales bacterium]|jgi:hypothetical protein|nr:hypothetical protein [Clostridiales bacterium]
MDIRYVIGPLFKIDNHINLAEHTSLILYNDGYEDIYLLLHNTDEVTGKTYLVLLSEGTRDADIPFSGGYICHMKHFHHPWSHRGYLSKTSSADSTSRLFAIATNNWHAGNKGKSIYHLGRALHLIQDIFIPQHSGITAMKGHGQLEEWLMKNWERYQVVNGGYYNWEETFCDQQDCHFVTSDKPYDWIDYGSHISIDWYNSYFADGRYNEDTFTEVASQIIPNVLRMSAGFIYRFFRDVEI